VSWSAAPGLDPLRVRGRSFEGIAEYLLASPAVEATVASADDFEAVPSALGTLSWRRHLRVERAVPTGRLTSLFRSLPWSMWGPSWRAARPSPQTPGDRILQALRQQSGTGPGRSEPDGIWARDGRVGRTCAAPVALVATRLPSCDAHRRESPSAAHQLAGVV